MKNSRSHFKFNKQERSGIFFLLLIIVLLQVGLFVFKVFRFDDEMETISVDAETQSQIDALKERALEKDSIKIYPFNPNFITDYKGYSLGMSVDEIDSLHRFRETNKYVNSPEEFQQVTQVSDSLLKVISPYFKFPEWTQKKSGQTPIQSKQYSKNRQDFSSEDNPSANETIKDLNLVTAEELKSINGIGDKLSARIIKFRDGLGGFIIEEQLYEVYGLEPEVVQRTLKKFKILKKPEIEKININTASANEISKLAYIQRHIAQRIVDYRNINGTIDSFDELATIQDFPTDKIDRIALYLRL